MTFLPLLVVLTATPAWRDEVLSDDPAVRSAALSHLHARGRAGLYAVQGLVEESADPTMRARAVRALGELGDPEAEWELRLQLKSASPRVAAAAVRAAQHLRLAGLARQIAERVGDPDSELCESLGAAAAEYPAIAANALEALEGTEARQLAGLRVLRAANLPIPGTVARRLNVSPVPEVRLAAAEGLAVSDPEAAVETLSRLLGGPLAARSLEALGRLGTPRALALLDEQLASPAVQGQVVQALARSTAGERILLKRRAALAPDSKLGAEIETVLEKQPGSPELLVGLLSDSDDHVANAAATSLGRHAAGRAALEACLEHLTPQAAHCAVGLAASPQAVAERGRALDSLEPEVRALMVAGLAAGDARPALTVLVRMAADPSPDVRIAVAMAAGRLANDGIDLLLTLARDNQAAVRSAATAQLVQVLPADRLRILASEAVADPAIREPLFKALDRLPVQDSMRLLRASLQDPRESERRQAMLALAHFHVPEAVNALMDSAASDTDPALREFAYSMLANQ